MSAHFNDRFGIHSTKAFEVALSGLARYRRLYMELAAKHPGAAKAWDVTVELDAAIRAELGWPAERYEEVLLGLINASGRPGRVAPEAHQ